MPRLAKAFLTCLVCALVALPALAAEDPRDPVADPASVDCAAAVGGDVLPALTLPGDDQRENRVYPACTITRTCSTGGTISCSSPGGYVTCRSGYESCTTWDGCQGQRQYVTCGLEDYQYCGCVKTQSNCPPAPSCPSGSACHFNSECGDGVCQNRRCLCF